MFTDLKPELFCNMETETQRRKLRIHSIFSNSNIDMHELPSEPYSSIRDMVLRFDKKVLQAAFKVDFYLLI
ncbi:hypothetical protein SASPL_143496 [Salvia splendens]|uniref:Uncharacterized protein n=1 Tax=Salvia splendens TaxID=180675 RepID=A0A8X8WM61_SALSN|nr:hypothetical protein SASPL_143496 [Salvia splendens]